MSRETRDFLVDILSHAELAARIAAESSSAEIAGDPVRRLALERTLEIVGEAAGKLPPEVRARYPDVPWAEMVGLRNRLAHGYFGLSLAILHRTARDVIPAMLPRLAEIVGLEAADAPPSGEP